MADRLEATMKVLEASHGSARPNEVEKPQGEDGRAPTTGGALLHVHERKWWKEATVYQIYPASFKDGNGDGLGDLIGITEKLPYLRDLGVDCVWISPMFDSPQVDMGYDISDYEAVYPPYGTLADMDVLIAKCHGLGMKLILDLVINHTSDQHKWFQESRSSKLSPKRDWYVWRPPKFDKDGKRQPPCNWRSNFQGSVWTWDEDTQEYYLHLFCPEQPDLNWENEECRQAIFDSAVRFWLDRGVDGFRVDTANMYSKPSGEFPDAPITDPEDEWQPAGTIYCNGPRIHEYYKQLHNEVLSKYDCFTVGELPCTPDTDLVRQYISAASRELSEIFQFDVVDIDVGLKQRYETDPEVECIGKSWSLRKLKSIVERWQVFIDDTDAWTTVFAENHDQPRSISRYLNDAPEFRAICGKLLAIMNATLTGTLYVYQGQEIGMINCPEDWSLDEYIDVDAVNYVNVVKHHHAGDAKALERARKGIRKLARDNARTPMQWDASPFAGFSTTTPWHRVHDNYPEVNVESALAAPSSVLHFWRQMLQLRKQYADIFIYGRFALLDEPNPCVFTYTKTTDRQRALVVLNFMPTPQAIEPRSSYELLVSNCTDSGRPDELHAYEGRVYMSSL